MSLLRLFLGPGCWDLSLSRMTSHEIGRRHGNLQSNLFNLYFIRVELSPAVTSLLFPQVPSYHLSNQSTQGRLVVSITQNAQAHIHTQLHTYIRTNTRERTSGR